MLSSTIIADLSRLIVGAGVAASGGVSGGIGSRMVKQLPLPG
jgi:hypothetical protein